MFQKLIKQSFFYLELKNSSDNVDKVNESLSHHVVFFKGR